MKIVKVDANANRSWAGSQNVRGVPTFQFYQGGMLVHQFVGAYPESEIQKKIDQYAMVLASTGGGEGKARFSRVAICFIAFCVSLPKERAGMVGFGSFSNAIMSPTDCRR